MRIEIDLNNLHIISKIVLLLDMSIETMWYCIEIFFS